ncbi:MAG TPA: ribonuclease HII [Thermoleophilia bacterium]|nr:ribonuclease HII [Thermoleophilia bacterium]
MAGAGGTSEKFAFDLAAAGREGAAVAGADEAGRGCLAGPLAAAAVCLDYAALDEAGRAALTGLDDSKRLTRERREELYDVIVRLARQVVVVLLSPATIDRDGLHRCNLAALGRCLERLHPAPDAALVDGFRLPGCQRAHEAVVGGDRLSAAVAAASIVAKVTRDRVMRGLHDSFPAYGFDSHVGYATAAHQAAICEHGVCELHRLSFASAAYQQLGLDIGADATC